LLEGDEVAIRVLGDQRLRCPVCPLQWEQRRTHIGYLLVSAVDVWRCEMYEANLPSHPKASPCKASEASNDVGWTKTRKKHLAVMAKYLRRTRRAA
jgi:hypothetical protein